MRRFFPFILMLAACGTDAGGDNQAPTLTIDVTSEISATVGEDVVRITVRGEDPEGGDVSLSIVNQPERSDFQANGAWGVFTWDPISSDVTAAGPRELVFVATDSQGLSTEKVVLIVVLAGNGVPRFVNSASVLHNAASGAPVSFEVKVRDDDSNTVSIRMPEGFAPAGAELSKTGEFTAQFGWIPSAEQIQQRVHTVRFIANDGVNEPVNQDVTVILKKDTASTETPDSTGCLFEDTVTYEALRAQRTTSEHVIVARLTDPTKGYDRLTLNYTDGDAFNDFELQWESVAMAPDGDRFVGVIPNRLGTDVKEIYFEICAINDDPSEEDGFPVLCGPSSLYGGFLSYPPGTAECEDDPYDYVDDFESSSEIPGDEWLYRRMCEGKDDFFEVGLGTNQEATIYFVYPIWAQPTIEVYNLEGQLVETIAQSSCGGFTDVNLQNQGAPTKRFIKVIGGADATDMAYQVTGNVVSLTDPSACIDAAYEPNDLATNATPVTTATAMYSGLEICRADDIDVFAIQAEIGQQIHLRANFQSAVADIDMRLHSPGQEIGRNQPAVDYSLGISDVEEITYVAKTAGTFHATIYSVDNPNRYSLLVEVGAAAQTCADTDVYEPNDSQATAKTLSIGTANALQACLGTDDWYSFYVIDAFSESFDAIVTPTGGATPQDFALEIWDVFGKVADGNIIDDKLKANLYPFADGDHYIVVRPLKDATYALELVLYTMI